MERRLKWSQIF